MALLTERPTVRVSNIPQTIIAKELLQFLESKLGPDSVFALEIVTDYDNWKPRDYGRVQFASLEAKSLALSLALENKLFFKSRYLSFSETYDDIITRPVNAGNRLDGIGLRVGFMVGEDRLCVLESWKGVSCWVMPERNRCDLWVWQSGECYKLEVRFEDVSEAHACCVNGRSRLNAVLLKLHYGPKIYHKVSGPDVASKFRTDRYHICKEDHDFLWVRTTDFSPKKSIGHSTSFCLEVQDPETVSDVFSCFLHYKRAMVDLNVEDGERFQSSSEIVPLVHCDPSSELPYEILFQLNSLVHAQKISFGAINPDLIEILNNVSLDIALWVLRKLHQQSCMCYDPLEFIITHLDRMAKVPATLPLSPYKRLIEHNIMTCYRGHVTPSRIYLLGPELEKSNYIVKNFAEYASDFMRVTFVEEDWSKLPANAISVTVKRGLFVAPFKTKIHHRILSVLKDGIVIGAKRFEFLAFSASQLRSNSVWMFASNDKVRAQDIRQWMGSFTKIRSVSKCAARMGQLFSSSKQTLVVSPQEVEIIPDIEVDSDGIKYCFSDGIGKISLSFARQVSEKCGLSYIPSAFQIRYGGYKGVVAVDKNSFRKLSLRKSMLKFESKNRMLNVTKWSESMPCFLNREIICLLSTLGIEDEVFESMQQEHLSMLGDMLETKEAALDTLKKFGGADSKSLLAKMLIHGYEPSTEPYLSMMLRTQKETQLSELRSRCRIFVPKGRILIGCLDETHSLEYGEVYIRITMTKAELESVNQRYFHKVDEETVMVIGKVVVTKNPCLHPGDIRVLDAVYSFELDEKGFVDCIVFPQQGERPHPNECGGGDLDGDQFFVSWDERLIPSETDAPMDYTGSRPRIMDHDVTLEEIHKFFVDYMINDSLGAISTAHLVHADREPNKARSEKCLGLAYLHSRAVDFAKTGAPAEMPRVLKPKEFPDFLERSGKPVYVSNSIFGKLYRALQNTTPQDNSHGIQWKDIYDHQLEVEGHEFFLGIAKVHKDMYGERLRALMAYYGAETEEEILAGNLRNRATYLLRDNRKYSDVKDRISISIANLHKEAREWFKSSCQPHGYPRLASAWYHVTYHPDYAGEDGNNLLSFPWIMADILLSIKSEKNRDVNQVIDARLG